MAWRPMGTWDMAQATGECVGKARCAMYFRGVYIDLYLTARLPLASSLSNPEPVLEPVSTPSDAISANFGFIPSVLS